MSGGLEKFEASESWRTNFKKFLFVERKPALKTTVTVSDTQRYSLDIGKDLQDLLEERKKQVEVGNPTTNHSKRGTSAEENKNGMSYTAPNVDDTFYERVKHDVLEKVSDESFEVVERMCEKTASDPNSSLFRYLQGDEGGIKKHAESPWRKTSDESFEALERMCDKTASDPDSTLFQYLHSDHRDQVLADAKKRSTDGSGDNIPKMDFGERDPLLGKFSDCTLLDEIEAPSRMWENTIAVDNGFRTSPIKMVGLMRPSTILEEAGDESANSDISSQTSFQTATTKGPLSDVSSAYDTAHDSTATTAHTNSSRQHQEELEIDVDEMLMLAIDKTRKQFPSLHLSHISPAAGDNRNTTCEVQNKPEEADISIDFIDLETTFGPTRSSPHSSVLRGDTMVDVVVIDDDPIDDNEIEQTVRDEEDISVIDILSDEEEDRLEDYNDIKLEQESQDSNNITDEQREENKENYSFEPLSSERSMKFNDTMEEVEYLLKKGMEYMAARENAVEKEPENNNEQPVSEVAITQPNSPMLSTHIETLAVPSSSKVKLRTSSTFIKTPKKNIEPFANRCGLDVKPFPKLDIFGRSPQTTLGNPRHKELASKQFAHIVSPIGTYMKKTASTPLMSTCKMKNKNANALNSLASRELEYESRLCQPKIGTNSSDLFAAIPGLSGSPNMLPKKAYISSELKHIVDERTPVTIPGGKKIQKYLENAMMPAVLRHDGKMKIGGGVNAIPASLKTPLKMANSNTTSAGARTASTATTYRNNASLADLSVMSGDVSMYTIMDAQKF